MLYIRRFQLDRQIGQMKDIFYNYMKISVPVILYVKRLWVTRTRGCIHTSTWHLNWERWSSECKLRRHIFCFYIKRPYKLTQCMIWTDAVTGNSVARFLLSYLYSFLRYSMVWRIRRLETLPRSCESCRLYPWGLYENNLTLLGKIFEFIPQ